VLCDELCQVEGFPGIYAAGDVARWQHRTYGSIRVEQWTNAVEQALAVAHNIAHPDEPQPYHPTPYFWSDQFGVKIQYVGQAQPGDDFAVIDGDLADGEFAGTFTRDGRVVACVGFNRPRIVSRYRRLISAELVVAGGAGR
jgi:NADPH-dependent 2,4-dienoyl-CoA reductase/sulfur reductase-like enzyme